MNRAQYDSIKDLVNAFKKLEALDFDATVSGIHHMALLQDSLFSFQDILELQNTEGEDFGIIKKNIDEALPDLLNLLDRKLALLYRFDEELTETKQEFAELQKKYRLERARAHRLEELLEKYNNIDDED